MQWIDYFDLFLFDCDGLLVDSEPLHYQAYLNMCEHRGVQLSWDLSTFLSIAHKDGTALQEAITLEFLERKIEIPEWEILYREKKKEYQDLLDHGKISLMPGVDLLLSLLEKKGKKRCVVTHSPLIQIEAIRSQHPILQTIPHWITREDYHQPKPNPECYLQAISLYGKSGDRIIGFEDSMRGLKALMGTSATPVLICPWNYPHLDAILGPSVIHAPSFDELEIGKTLSDR